MLCFASQHARVLLAKHVSNPERERERERERESFDPISCMIDFSGLQYGPMSVSIAAGYFNGYSKSRIYAW